VPNFLAIAPVLAGSDLLATLPSLAMAGTVRPFGLDVRRVPFAIEPLPHALLWSAARKEPEIMWLRNRLRPIVQKRFAR
jgi:DNA-binding transcriptional LysR family regulator